MRLISGKTPDRIHDLLSIDMGWWTSEQLAMRLDLTEEHVRRTLHRLRERGYVESRPIRNYIDPFPMQWWRKSRSESPKVRHEWRAA